ncbi:MAG: Sec-independent protein translocase protein TatB [Bdellovibrionales bacterium]
MFNLGFWEMVVLAVIALVVVGPEKLPSMARNIGRFLNDLKRTTNTLTAEINSTIDEEAFLKDQKGKSEVVDDETAELHGIDKESELEGVDDE